MPTTDRPRRDQESSGTGMAAAGIGAAVLVIACCAGPALVAAGALGALGGFLGNPWVIAAAIVILVAAVTAVVRRRHSGRDACCPPAEAAGNSTRPGPPAYPGRPGRPPGRGARSLASTAAAALREG